MSDNLILMIIKKLKKLVILLTIFTIGVLGLNLIWIYSSTKDRIYFDYNELPYNKVGLIPGCNKYVSDGVINIYYTQRIGSAVKLFNAGKIDFILVSGDNAHESYDEPREMKNSLIEQGIPKEKIYSDYAGFRTLDTIIRSKEVFKLDKVTFISQNFQNQRGVFIGKNKGMDIVAFNVDDKDFEHNFKTKVREVFAKTKMMIDLYLLSKEPKFLGDEIIIN